MGKGSRAVIALITPLLAPTAALGAENVTDARHDHPQLEEVRVFANPLRDSSTEVAQPVSVLSGEALRRHASASIGETVAQQPGIHSSYFGPAVGRPVIRGLSGPRVRVLEDGIGTLDVSTTSDDHATTVEPFLVEQVEMLRGPASVLYGSGAIGGVVNTVTGRIPTERAAQPLSLRGELRAGDVADERIAALRADGGGERIAWHLEGLSRDTEEFDIPGPMESTNLRAEEGELDEPVEESGTLENSDIDTEAYGGGLSFFSDRAMLGLAVSRFETDYGLPGGHVHEDHGGGPDPDEEEGGVRIGMEQTRYDLQASLFDPLPGLIELRLRTSYNDYEHEEVEPSGEVGSVYANEALEARLEAIHEPVFGFTGAVGIQLEDRDLDPTGEEAFVPAVDRSAAALFLFEERPLGASTLQLGARLERVDYDPDGASGEDFLAYSLSAGALVPLNDVWGLALQADLASRAPALEELFSDGPHLATQTFEIGDPDLDEERALNLSVTLNARTERLQASLSLFHTAFDDFIFLRDTGLEEDELPVRLWSQADARLLGAEFEATWHLGDNELGSFDVRGFGDYVRGQLDDRPAPGVAKDLPRMPPARLGIALEFSRPGFGGELRYMRVMRQDDTAEFELPTDAYDMLDAYVGFHFDPRDEHVEVFLKATNLLDSEARAHTSFIKDLAPMPGRGVQIGVRLDV